MRLMTASPLSMGLLIPGGVPEWHPSWTDDRNQGLVDATKMAEDLAEKQWGHQGGLVDLALGFGLRNVRYRVSGETEEGAPDEQDETTTIPVVVGAKNLEEVHAAIKAWRRVNVDGDGGEESSGGKTRKEVEKMARECYIRSGWEDVSWASPTSETTRK